MIFNAAVLLLIVMIMLYLATQGMLAALLALATAMFSSVMAMALTEPLQGIIGAWRIDYARGVTFLILFLAVFAITRIAADIAVPRNIKLQLWVNRIAGGFIGFFTALIVVGTIVIGIEMLPLPRVILGYDRFPNGIKGEAPGDIGKMSGVWFSPDRFVLSIWSATSGRSLGGNKGWTAVHPDLSIESYGYRNNVRLASARSVPPELFDATTAWSIASADAKEYLPLGIPTEGKRIVMVRTEVSKGDSKRLSSDPNGDPYFRVSATQVRLVTDKRRQYYPIGTLEFGGKYVELPLDTGHLVEDYVNSKAIDEWIFRIPDDETPALIELKQLGRKELAGILKPKVVPSLAMSAYPQHPYFKDLGSLTVNLDTRGKKLVAANVYLLKPTIPLGDIRSEVNSAYERAKTISSNISNGASGWSNTAKAGVPPAAVFSSAVSQGPNILNSEDKQMVNWSNVLPLMLAGQAESVGDQNIGIYSHYFEERLPQLWQNARTGSVIRDRATTKDGAKLELSGIVKGNHSIVITLQTDRGFYAWYQEHDFGAGENMSINAVGDSSLNNSMAPSWKIDLDQK